MYDPEFNLEIERRMQSVLSTLQVAKNSLSDGNPAKEPVETLIQLISNYDELFHDHESCFDDDRLKLIEEEMDEIVKKVDELFSEVMQMVKEQMKNGYY